MPLYTGDWIRDTLHLSPSEQGIYFRLVMHCWDQQGPAPLDERRLCGIVNARSGDEIEALRRVLAEYFVRTDDGYFNTKVERVLAACRVRVENAIRAGRASGEARRIAAERDARTPVERPLNERSMPVEPPLNQLTPTPTPTPIQPKDGIPNTTHPPAAQGGARRSALRAPNDVDVEVWGEWVAHRRTKRAPVTERVVEAMRSEASGAGMTLQQAITECMLRGWTGFKAAWVTPHGQASTGRGRAAPQRKADAMMAGNIAVAQRYFERSEDDSGGQP